MSAPSLGRGAAALTVLLAGVLPAIQASRTSAMDALRAVSRGSSAARSPMRSALMIGQTMLSVVLLIGAGLFGFSLSYDEYPRSMFTTGPDQTLPLAIYAEFDVNFDATLAMSGVLILISVLLLLTLRIALSWRSSPSTRSRFLYGLSGSA